MEKYLDQRTLHYKPVKHKECQAKTQLRNPALCLDNQTCTRGQFQYANAKSVHAV